MSPIVCPVCGRTIRHADWCDSVCEAMNAVDRGLPRPQYPWLTKPSHHMPYLPRARRPISLRG